MGTSSSSLPSGSTAPAGSIAVEPGDEEDRVARVALSWLAEPGQHTVWSLVQQFGAPATLDLLTRGDLPDTNLRASVLAKTADLDPRRRAETLLRQAARCGARVVVPADPEWPTQLDDLAALTLTAGGRVNHDVRPPLCLWVRGDPPLAETLQRAVAVVGARGATGYGLRVASDIAYGLAEHGWTVAAGGALGVDTTAHRAALAAGGRTVAVLAGGLDRTYPAANAALFDRIATGTGLLISEYPMGAEPLKYRFLSRNRIVAAATAGTVVVEAALHSGSVQMMGPVLALARVAMVVPGPVTSALSAGTHSLLRTHPQAHLVTGVPHILEALDGPSPDAPATRPGAAQRRHRCDDQPAPALDEIPAQTAVTPE